MPLESSEQVLTRKELKVLQKASAIYNDNKKFHYAQLRDIVSDDRFPVLADLRGGQKITCHGR